MNVKDAALPLLEEVQVGLLHVIKKDGRSGGLAQPTAAQLHIGIKCAKLAGQKRLARGRDKLAQKPVAMRIIYGVGDVAGSVSRQLKRTTSFRTWRAGTYGVIGAALQKIFETQTLNVATVGKVRAELIGGGLLMFSASAHSNGTGCTCGGIGLLKIGRRLDTIATKDVVSIGNRSDIEKGIAARFKGLKTDKRRDVVITWL